MGWIRRMFHKEEKRGRMENSFIKHSLRTIRKGCEHCGETDLYWAHDLDTEGKGYCDRCETYGDLVLVDPYMHRHNCPASHGFKVGDKVRVTDGKAARDYYAQVHDGDTGEVVFLDSDRITHLNVQVRMDNSIHTWAMDPRHIEKVEKEYDLGAWVKEYKSYTQEWFEKNLTPEGFQEGIPFTKTKEVQDQLATKTKKAPEISVDTKQGKDVGAALALLMESLSPSVDKDDIRDIIKEEFQNTVFPTRTVIQTPKGEIQEIEGKTHHKVADIIMDLDAGEHVMMVGPAGTGKSTIAEQAAGALGFPFYAISLSPQTPASQILGYQQAAGEYVRSLYREAFENGGVFHFDEIDNAHPSVLAVINASLANGQMAFPDKMVERHKNFRCVASANTYGRGADRAYVGRQQIDAATLDRFTIETIEIDEALETDLCLATGLDNDRVTHVLSTVRKYRKNAANKKMTTVISPRASIGMCRLLQAGKTWEDALEARVRRGMSDADWAKLTG